MLVSSWDTAQTAATGHAFTSIGGEIEDPFPAQR